MYMYVLRKYILDYVLLIDKANLWEDTDSWLDSHLSIATKIGGKVDIIVISLESV